MSSMELSQALNSLDARKLQEATKAFMSVDKALTIRRGVVAGKEQLDQRLRRAIAAYLAGTAV